MKIAGFGCTGCSLLFALAGAVAIAMAMIPGVVNSAETGTAVGIGSSLCAASFMPFVVGIVLIIVGGKKADAEV